MNLKHFLRNELSETGEGGGSPVGQARSLDPYADIAKELIDEGISIDGEVKSEVKEAKAPKAAPAKPKKEITDLSKMSPDEMLESMKGNSKDVEVEEESEDSIEAAPEDSDEISEELEELLHNGEIKTVPKSEAKKLAQMGLDYTQKTQKLAEEKKSFLAEKEQTTQEIEKAYKELESKWGEFETNNKQFQELSVTLDHIHDNYPDLYAQFKQAFGEATRMYNNPIYKRQFDQYGNEISALKKELEGYKHQEIRKGFSSEVSSLKSELGDQLAAIGVHPDWDGAIKDAYANGAANVKAALYAVYGEQIRAGFMSKMKLDQVQKKTSRTVPTMNKTNKSAPMQKGKNLRDMSWEETIQHSLRA